MFLFNNTINSLSINTIKIVHYPFITKQHFKKLKKIGVIFGKFYPLHTGHIYLIHRAFNQVDKLYIILCYDEIRDDKLFKNSLMPNQPTPNDRLNWLLQTFKYQENIYVFLFNEQGIQSYPHGWSMWSNQIKIFMIYHNIIPDFIFSSEIQDIPYYHRYFNIKTILIDPYRSFINISSSKIRKDPLFYWDYIPIEVRRFLFKQ